MKLTTATPSTTKIGPASPSISQNPLVAIACSIALCLLPCSLQAQGYYPWGPKEFMQEIPPEASEEPPLECEEDKVIVPSMKGLLLVSSSESVQKNPPSFQGVAIQGVDLPGSEEELSDQLAPLIVDQPLTKRQISAIKRQINRYYRKHHHPVITILVPKQEITNGILQLVVVESRVDHVIARGARHFSNERIRRQIHLKEGDAIDLDILLRDVAWLNQNPFRQTNVSFSPGSKPWTTDVNVVTQDRRPLRVFAGANNTGTEFTGRTRFFTGLNWGNVFNLNHMFTFQWSTCDDLKKFNAYTASYTALLPWRNILSAFGGYSRVKPEMLHFRSDGWSAQASLRYQIFLGKTYGPFLQDINAGYDFKWTNNNLEFVERTTVAFVETKVAQISQFLLSYHFDYNRGPHAVMFSIESIFSPFQNWFRHHNKEAFQLLQPGSYPIYIYGRALLNEEYRFWKNASVFIQARGQLSNRILLPSEQFGLGGYDSVRGYPERAVNYDNGVCLNFELRSPPLSVLQLFRCQRQDDSLILLAFADYGYGRPHKVEHPTGRHLDPPGKTLAGIGPGLRYKFKSYIIGRADCGIPLTPLNGRNAFDPWFHFGVVANY